MNLLKIADVPPATVAPGATVIEAVSAMVEHRVGAVAVVDKEILQGIFTERDVMLRVVLQQLDPTTTKMSQVMTREVRSITKDTKPLEALNLMIERHFRHLPITEENGKMLGMLSIRNLLQRRVEDLCRELDSMETYMTADGPGG